MSFPSVSVILSILKSSFKEFRKRDPVRLAGTLAFFTIFAIPPIMIIIITATGWIIGPELVSGKVYSEIYRLVGPEGAKLVRDIVNSYSSLERNILGTIFGVLIIGVLRNGLVLMGISPFWQETVIGAVIILAVGVDKWTRSRREQ